MRERGAESTPSRVLEVILCYRGGATILITSSKSCAHAHYVAAAFRFEIFTSLSWPCPG